MQKTASWCIALCLFLAGTLFLFPACNNVKGDQPAADVPVEVSNDASELLKLQLSPAQNSATYVNLHRVNLVRQVYERNGFVPVWSHKDKWLSTGESVFDFLRKSRRYGLFPEDYHLRELQLIIERMTRDKEGKTELKPSYWVNADLMLTDAFMGIVHDIRMGRIPADSLTERNQTVLADSFYMAIFDRFQRGASLEELMNSLEPRSIGYQRLKSALPKFLDSSDYRTYTTVPLPSAKKPDFRRLLQRRLYEGGYIAYDSIAADSVSLASAVKKFQEQKGISVDGVPGDATVRMLNVNDAERFVRIAISMDKYKLLPEEMPDRYIWVNASANYLELVEDGNVMLYSKVICGKPRTRTPLLTSYISELITYPQWVPPPSIVSKEILPAVKKNPSYLRKKGFSLQDREGKEVDPDSVDWSKFKTMPYRVVQGSGDANALGIMKFVFSNKYSVYLHDTNQRYLFGNSMRSLSHGCVRVEAWEELARHIIQSDAPGQSGQLKIDSMQQWLKQKQKRSISIRNRLPVYIRYFTCEGTDKGIAFYDDVYGEDRYLREKYFAGK
jgi:murein L,D-transpeptidase YcbB/YkuD